MPSSPLPKIIASGRCSPLHCRWGYVLGKPSAILRGAKLPTIRIHDLRHTCASLLLAQDVNPRVVMETLGHSQISLTLDTYSYVLPALEQGQLRRWMQFSPRSTVRLQLGCKKRKKW